MRTPHHPLASRIAFTLFLAGAVAFATPARAQQLTLNLVAVNAAPDESKTIDVKYHLPKELEPDDILDTGPLRLDYDVGEGKYFVFGNVQFAPKETKTFKVRVNDVWRVTPEEIGILKDQIENNLTVLEGKEVYSVAVDAKDKIHEQLDYILAQQENLSDNIGRRIEQYRAYAQVLDDIRDKVFNLNYLQYDAQALNEINQASTVRFVVEVNNPLEESTTIDHKHYLPEEIKDMDVLEKGDFTVRYDEKRGKSYLAKEETLNPGETKRYQFVLRDVWQLPLVQLSTMEERAQRAIEEIEGSDFVESGEFLFNAIKENVDSIRLSQAQEDAGIPDHIGKYRINLGRYQQAESDLEKIEQLLAIVRAKRLEELESRKVKNVLERLRALRGLRELSEALFKKGISVTQTWRIIMGTIAFLAVFTGLHFFIWSRRSGKAGEELGLKEGEEMTVVPKPGEKKKEDEDEE